ncbi:MAG: hypothetical protein AAGA67_07295 [Cyanobacteria bacterium P01_F01_bin.153]
MASNLFFGGRGIFHCVKPLKVINDAPCVDMKSAAIRNVESGNIKGTCLQ